jgi:hypothetical protein
LNFWRKFPEDTLKIIGLDDCHTEDAGGYCLRAF